MAISDRIPVHHAFVFPAGAFVKGQVEPVLDFAAMKGKPKGTKIQKTTETGEPIWQVSVFDADEDASARQSGLTVKFVGHPPVIPENKTPFPMVVVEFENLTVLPWVDDSGQRPRVAYSFQATAMKPAPIPKAGA